VLADGDNKLRSYNEAEVEVRPGDIVWAKCAGYAWYPALVSDARSECNMLIVCRQTLLECSWLLNADSFKRGKVKVCFNGPMNLYHTLHKSAPIERC
jgi:hypothetical protein